MRGAARYEAMFERNARDGCGAFVPFTVLGDPDPSTSLEIVRTLASSGADALELGLAFSDPVADGGSVQAAGKRALGAGTTVERSLRIVTAIRDEFPDLPIGLLAYANLVMREPHESFHARAAAAGVDSLLVADAPLLEFARFETSGLKHGIAAVLIAPPNASEARLAAIASASRAFVYVTSRKGVTGADRELCASAGAVLGRLRELGSAPSLLGFGIGCPEHIRQALAMGAAGAFCGSAIASRIGDNLGDSRTMLSVLSGFVGEMKAATIATREAPG